jgi:hypothetical protein
LERSSVGSAPARARRLAPSRVELTIHEGRKHQVKRMLEAVGHPLVPINYQAQKVEADFRFALVQFSCLLIRGTARSILKAQHFIRQNRYGMQSFRTTNAPHFVSASPRGPGNRDLR